MATAVGGSGDKAIWMSWMRLQHWESWKHSRHYNYTCWLLKSGARLLQHSTKRYDYRNWNSLGLESESDWENVEWVTLSKMLSYPIITLVRFYCPLPYDVVRSYPFQTLCDWLEALSHWRPIYPCHLIMKIVSPSVSSCSHFGWSWCCNRGHEIWLLAQYLNQAANFQTH